MEKFLPYYPEEEENFEQLIYDKKEFYDEKLERRERPIGGLMRHQRFVARYMAAVTPYDKLLLVHEMGTGKTAASIAIAEGLRTSGRYNGAVIITRGKGMIDNFRAELAKFAPEEAMKWYTFSSYALWAKRVARGGSKFYANWSGKVIIVDEIHNIQFMVKKEKLTVYNEFWKFLHAVKDCKIVLMTGTPMRDSVVEMANVMNLLLPVDEQLPMGKQFMEEFVRGEEVVDDGRIARAMRGTVSYLRSQKSDVKKVWMEGAAKPTGDPWALYRTEMSDFQSKYYAEAWAKDSSSERSVWSNSIQAALWVWPDGTWGKKGFEKYISRDGKRLSRELKRALVGATVEETLSKIARHGAKYAAALRSILRDPSKNTFVFSSLVYGSGLILFSKLLELVGITKLGTRGDGKRYVLLTGETQQQFRAISKFNSPENRNGDVAQVIIGSRVIAEGFSFKNIQKEIILSPFWNYAQLEQVLARGIRLDSHADLPRPVTVEIVQLAATSSTPSIDVKMYDSCKSKDKLINSMMRVLHSSAVDCALNRERNRGVTKRECYYGQCDVKCNGIQNYSPGILNWNTWDLYYIDMEKYIAIVKDIFRDKWSAPIGVVADALRQRGGQQLSRFAVLKIISKIIDDDIEIHCRWGSPAYLRERSNIYYLSNYTGDASYSYRPVIFSPQDEGVGDLADLSPELLKTQLPSLPEDVQMKLLEYAIVGELHYTKAPAAIKKLRKAITDYYAAFVSKHGNQWRHQKHKNRCLDGELWKDCDVKIHQYLPDQDIWGAYNPQNGKFCIVDKRYQSDVGDDSRNIATGRVCTTKDLKYLVRLAAIDLAIPPPDDWSDDAKIKPDKKFNDLFSKQELEDTATRRRALYWGLPQSKGGKRSKVELCKAVKQALERSGLLVLDKYCGSYAKSKAAKKKEEPAILEKLPNMKLPDFKKKQSAIGLMRSKLTGVKKPRFFKISSIDGQARLITKKGRVVGYAVLRDGNVVELWFKKPAHIALAADIPEMQRTRLPKSTPYIETLIANGMEAYGAEGDDVLLRPKK